MYSVVQTLITHLFTLFSLVRKVHSKLKDSDFREVSHSSENNYNPLHGGLIKDKNEEHETSFKINFGYNNIFYEQRKNIAFI